MKYIRHCACVKHLIASKLPPTDDRRTALKMGTITPPPRS
jgi:hypothetical protein